jgi:hypothetical protein
MSRDARRVRPSRLGAVLWAIASLTSGSAWAGPPYITDDPEPTRTGGWENYLYISGTNTPGTTAGQAGVELNYGAAKDIGAKYRFLGSASDSWLPDAAVFPAVTVPTGARGFDTGHASLFIPVWLEKDFGKWSTFGGGGYDVNPGVGQQNYTFVGWAVTRSFGEHLNLGVEIYHQTPTISGGAALTNLGFGAIYQMTKHWAVMASGGPGLERPSRSGASAFYISLQFTN